MRKFTYATAGRTFFSYSEAVRYAHRVACERNENIRVYGYGRQRGKIWRVSFHPEVSFKCGYGKNPERIDGTR